VFADFDGGGGPGGCDSEEEEAQDAGCDYSGDG